MQPNKTSHLFFRLFHPEWYETPDIYQPDDELLLVVRSTLPTVWKVFRSNKWFHVQPPDVQLPKQGWKIHISAVPANCEEILRKVTQICYETNTAFKFTVDRRFVSLTLSKIWPREGSGKFITIYPRDEQDFRELIETLYQALQGFTGSYILSDRRYKDSQVVYYRYGGILPFSVLSYTGWRNLMLETPEGGLAPDWRTPYWNPPTWVTDPFVSAAEEEEEAEVPLKDGRYRIDSALGFSASGGVYLATDLQNNRQVVIKEARPATNIDAHGVDAVERLRKEYRFLQKLQGTSLAPEPLDLFQEWEHLFLVEEYLEGLDLGLVMISRSPLLTNPLITVSPKHEAKEDYLALLRKIWTSLARNLQIMHEKGIVFADFSIKNVIVTDTERGETRFIDFESAWEEGVDLPSNITTPGYASPTASGDSGKEDDIYGLGAVMLGSLFTINGIVGLDSSKKHTFIEALGTDLGVPAQLQFLIEQCMSDNFAERPTLQQVVSILDKAPTQCAGTPPAREEMVSVRELQETINRIMDYIRASADLSRTDRLFPADPEIFTTNPLNVAYGAAGVAYALARIEGEIPRKIRAWMLERPLSAANYPPGLYVGSSGIAWALWESGMHEFALQTLCQAEKHPLLWDSPDLFYGAAGYGLTRLHFYLATREQEHLDQAVEAGEWLLRTKHEDVLGQYRWSDNAGDIWIGYTRGSSGIALYLLYLGIATGDQRFVDAGTRALRFELARLEPTDEGFLSTPRGVAGTSSGVVTHYWFDGSAGVLTALVRFWAYTRDPEYLDMLDLLSPDTMRKYTSFPSLFQGLSGLGNVLLDLADFTGEERYFQAAHLAAQGALLHRLQRPTGIAFPGEQLLRISTDFGTGSAGIALFLDRLARQSQGQRPGNFNFLLDSLLFSPSSSLQGIDLMKEREHVTH